MSTCIIIAVKFGAVHRRSTPSGSRTTTGDPARVLKGGYYGKVFLTLTNENGEIIKIWTIGETSVEDLDVKPYCDFYVDSELKGAELKGTLKIGGAVVREALKSFGRL